MGRRTLLLITSVLLAAIGTAIVALYVRQADHRATQNEALGTYVVATQNIRQGSKITASELTTQRRRARDQPGTTVTDLDQVISRFAASDIPSGTPIDSRQLTREGADADSGAIRAGELGIDVQLEDPQRAVSLLGVDSWVRIYTLQGAASDQTMKPLVSKARVISVGGTLDPAAADGPDGRNKVASSSVPAAVVGLSVSPGVAAKLIDAQTKQVPMYFAVIPGVETTAG